jgi:hypothetical protein
MIGICPYYNIDHVEKFNRERHGAVFGLTQRYEVLGLPTIYTNELSPEDRGFIIGHTVWLKLVPSDFDLGPEDDPEIWLVTIANYDTIIRCERWDYDHAEFPFSVIESNYDGYSPMNPGATELLQPLQDLGDWIIGSHMDNVKKLINDMLVIDPRKINLEPAYPYGASDRAPQGYCKGSPSSRRHGLAGQFVPHQVGHLRSRPSRMGDMADLRLLTFVVCC